ncbi:hypothetical protein Hte_003284 [Hypoxylon texense]
MASASTKLAEADWLPYKHRIELMVYGEKLNNENILETLKSVRFEATKNQLEAQLEKWGIRRKLPKRKSKAGWQCAGHRVAKRKKQGKESQVIIDGIVHDPQRVAKEISRNQPSSLEVIRRAIPSRAATLTQATDALLDLLARSATAGEQDVVCQNAHTSPLKISRLIAGLRSFMPEAYPNEFMRRAQRILNGSDNDRLEQVIMIVLFQLSNNIHSDEFADMWPTILGLIKLSGIMDRPLELKPQKENGMINATRIAVAEKLFRIAFQAVSHFDTWQSDTIQNGTRALIKWLLLSGYYPNITISTGTGSLRTPLLAAILYHEADLVLTLLDNGADPNFIPIRCSSSTIRKPRLPLIVAIDSDDYTQRSDIVKALLRKGADPNLFDTYSRTCPLRAAIGRQDLPTVALLIEHGARISQWDVRYYNQINPTDLEEPIKFFTTIRTALGCAAGIDPELAALSMVEYLLGQLRKDSNSDELTKAIPAESLLTAAARGYTAVLTLLFDRGADVNAISMNYAALHVAAYYGHYDTCRMLLERGALVEHHSRSELSPLYLAALGDHSDVVQLLHQRGADINRSVCIEEYTSAYYLLRANIYLHRPAPLWTSPSAAMKRVLSFCTSPVGAAMHIGNTGSTYRYLVSKGAILPPWIAHHAARDLKDFELVSFLVENGQDVNQRKPGGQTLLQAVLTIHDETDERTRVSCGEMASALLDRGVGVVGGEVVQAVLLGNWDLAERIRHQDPNCVAQEHLEMTMIHAALLSRKADIIWEVLKRNPEAYDPRALCVATLLACDADDEMIRVVDQLLKNRPPSEIAVDPEKLAVGTASWYENIPLLRLLLEKLPPFQRLNISQLPLSRDQHFVDTDPAVVCAFEPIGIRPTGKTVKGVSPLIFALESPQARSLLLHHGYEADVETLAAAIRLNDIAMVKELLPRQQCPVGQGLLSRAVQDGSIEIVKILLEAGENIDDRKGPGKTPLQAAILRGDPSILNLVLDKHPDVNVSSYFWPPALQMACAEGYLSLAKRLIDLGADINAKPDGFPLNCRTALERAAENGRIDMIQLLLSSGAGTTGELRGSYMYAIKSAEHSGHHAAAKLLKVHCEWTLEDETVYNETEWEPPYI